jgi:GT2 family glycosyltransferase
MSKSRVCLVTVTYGQRVAYVLKALESALVEGVQHAIVIDNGSAEPVGETLRERFGDWVSVERFDINQGSAPGFKRGMQLAYGLGCELILLLDDDNQLTAGCLEKLILARRDLANRYSDNNCMVLAYRPGHQPAEGVGETNGFLGFDVKDIPQKIGKRIGLASWVRSYSSLGKSFQLPYAPYSGMLFHRSVVENHGLPDEHFVLYADDSEYSYRLTASGGCVAIVPHALLAECERSWNVATDRKGFINKLASTKVDFRIYYAIRNRCYFEQFCLKACSPAREFNKRMFLLLLRLACAVHGNKQNWKILRQAIDDGENQRLGRSHCAAVQFS